MKTLLRRWVVAGLLVWVPLGVTLLLLRFVLGALDTSLLLLPESWRPQFPGLGVLLSVGLVLGTGALTANFIGTEIISWVEAALARVPFLGSVYGGMKKLAENLFSGQGKSFREAVLVQWPRAGAWSVGFITAETGGELRAQSFPDAVTVFIPTTPNPTSGFITIVSRAELRPLQMSVDQAMSLVISLGVVNPDAPAKADAIR